MSIQDDYFDLSNHLEKYGPEWAKTAFDRIWEWGVDCENENEKLRPIVNGIRNSISLMFEESDEKEKESV